MSASPRPGGVARSLGVVLGGTAVLEGVFAAFLFLMSTLTVAETGAALVLGAVVALVALVAVLVLWRGSRTGRLSTGALWTCRLLPVVGAVVAAALALLSVLSWLAVPLAFFAAAPAAVLAMVAPQLVGSAPAGTSGRGVGAPAG